MERVPTRVDIAVRIHHLLLRDLGQGFDIEQMLLRSHYARDVLLVCDAYKGHELARLAQQYRDAAPVTDEMGRMPQSIEWSRNTSGFGMPRQLDGSPGSPSNLPPDVRSERRAADHPPDASAPQHRPSRWWHR